MKTLNLKLSALPALIICLLISSRAYADDADSIVFENDSVFTIQSVQEELTKDGEWIRVNKDEIDPEGVTDGSSELDDNLNYEYVWRPYGVGPDWVPYTNGYWVYTNCGWMWMSYYTWGWRTCHYGRWWWHPAWGWVWSPGYVWAPSWVVWIFYDGYCGWYPISPRIRWHHRHHRWYCHNMRFHVRHWTFCETKEFTGGPGKPIVIVDPPGIQGSTEIFKKGKIYTEVKVENEKVVNKGPDATDIEKYSGKKVKTDDATKYNNVKVITKDEKISDGEKIKINNKQRNDESEKIKEKQRNDEGNKNNDNERNDQGNKNNESKDRNKSNDQGNKNNEKKSNDNEKVKQPEKKYEQPKQYSPPPQEKQKQNNPPPKNDDRDNGNNNGGKQDTQVNKDNGSGKDNNNEKRK